MIEGYLKLGIEHILDPNGLDHVLFLVVLVIIYTLKDWKSVFWLATAFTIGHSITLALASFNIVNISSDLVEFLIAVTIAIAAISNIFRNNKVQPYIYLTTILFGLIHGIGFSGFFRSLMGKESIAKPLFAFNLGVEIAQLIIVFGVLLVSQLIYVLLPTLRHTYIKAVSLVVLLASMHMIYDRFATIF